MGNCINCIQISQWGENAKWKIDLVLLDKPPGSSAMQGSSSSAARHCQTAGNASPIAHQNYSIPPPPLITHHPVNLPCRRFSLAYILTMKLIYIDLL